MGYTYDPTLPTDQDYVRFLIGDTDVTVYEVEDEEIAAILVREPDVLSAACLIAISRMAAAAKALKAATMKQVGRLKIEELRDEVARWKDVCDALRDAQSETGIVPSTAVAGISNVGTSAAERITIDSDPDRRRQRFQEGDFPHAEEVEGI